VVLAVAACLLLRGGARPAQAYCCDGFTDITGTPLKIDVRFPVKETGAMIELPISPSQLGPLPPQVQGLLNGSLSQLFDQTWNGTPEANGKTLRDNSCESIRQAVLENIASSKYRPYNLACHPPPTPSPIPNTPPTHPPPQA